MKGEEFMKAVGDIGDKYIIECAYSAGIRENRFARVARLASVAACFVLIFVSVFAFIQNNINEPGDYSIPDDRSTPSVLQSEEPSEEPSNPDHSETESNPSQENFDVIEYFDSDDYHENTDDVAKFSSFADIAAFKSVAALSDSEFDAYLNQYHSSGKDGWKYRFADKQKRIDLLRVFDKVEVLHINNNTDYRLVAVYVNFTKGEIITTYSRKDKATYIEFASRVNKQTSLVMTEEMENVGSMNVNGNEVSLLCHATNGVFVVGEMMTDNACILASFRKDADDMTAYINDINSYLELTTIGELIK